MNEIEEWNKWLLDNKNIDLSLEYNEYLAELKSVVKTLDDVLDYLCELNNITKKQLLFQYGSKSRGGSNKIPRIRGSLVKAVLLNYPKDFKSKNVYKKLFNVYKDHSTGLHFKNHTEFYGKELEIYKKIENYIKTYNIKWEH